MRSSTLFALIVQCKQVHKSQIRHSSGFGYGFLHQIESELRNHLSAICNDYSWATSPLLQFLENSIYK